MSRRDKRNNIALISANPPFDALTESLEVMLSEFSVWSEANDLKKDKSKCPHLHERTWEERLSEGVMACRSDWLTKLGAISNDNEGCAMGVTWKFSHKPARFKMALMVWGDTRQEVDEGSGSRVNDEPANTVQSLHDHGMDSHNLTNDDEASLASSASSESILVDIDLQAQGFVVKGKRMAGWWTLKVEKDGAH